MSSRPDDQSTGDDVAAEQVARWLASAGAVTVLTGAGVSTDNRLGCQTGPLRGV